MVAALEQLLDVSEQIAMEEARKLELALEDTKRQAETVAASDRACQQKTSLLQAILDNMAEGVVVVDGQGEFLVFNPAARAILGVHTADGNASSCAENFGLHKPDMLTRYEPDELPIAQALRGQAVDGAECFVRNSSCPGGRWLSVNARPLRNREGAVMGGVAVFRDTTELKRASGCLERTAERLSRSNRDLEEFALFASRDLRAPMVKLQAKAMGLQDACKETLHLPCREFLGQLLQEAARVQEVIGQYLEYAHVSSHGPEFAPVDLEATAREAIALLEPRRLELQGSIELAPLPSVEADPGQMRLLLQNLILNGLQARRPDVPPVVRVAGCLLPAPAAHLAGSPACCRLTVEDNGQGCDQRLLDQMLGFFQWRERASTSTCLSIGLVVCQRIVERHGGSIGAASAPGRGTVFTVTLPIRQGRDARP
jgi:PAS domain S-box-containing protein